MRARFAFHHPGLAILASPFIMAYMMFAGLYYGIIYTYRMTVLVVCGVAWIVRKIRDRSRGRS